MDRFDLQLLSQCGSTPETHWHVAGTLGNQQTTTLVTRLSNCQSQVRLGNGPTRKAGIEPRSSALGAGTSTTDLLMQSDALQSLSSILIFLSSSYISRSLVDRWGTTVDFPTNFLHSSLFSASRSMMFHSRPVHSLMLSSHRFLCLPLRLPP